MQATVVQGQTFENKRLNIYCIDTGNKNVQWYPVLFYIYIKY